MAITAISDLDDLRTRVRLMAGIEQVELDNETLDTAVTSVKVIPEAALPQLVPEELWSIQ